MAATHNRFIHDFFPTLLDAHQQWDLLSTRIYHSLPTPGYRNSLFSHAIALSSLSYPSIASISILAADQGISSTTPAIDDLPPDTRSSHGTTLVRGAPFFSHKKAGSTFLQQPWRRFSLYNL
ncbi:hypothetical protein KP509_29G066200 [Ceratopteris richardii]|uniref:Uncharacterized protein n=1 Tax=Ceratopteris richardii TaxID=49495 RepID=A0A8T2R7L9_CERRI|nr:hypothetical protein KP509_29G066200 [Ceratopteris richardii]